MIYVIATIEIKPGSLTNVLGAVAQCINATRNEPGCISYDLNQNVNNENLLTFVERWQSAEDLEQHFVQPHMKLWRNQGGPHIVDRKIEIIDPKNVREL